jgi:hypothetical protein
MVEGGPIDVLTGDWLAELTMLILSRIRAKRPGGGYARTFVDQMEEVMGTCMDRGIKVVSNAGGLDPDGCADAVAEVAQKLGLNPTIAFVNGDDLMPRLEELIAAGALQPFESGDPTPDPAKLLTANAYLGCWGIVEALNAGADIVVTGRVTDAAVVCGPAAWHHGWTPDDLNALAGAVVAGHVIECGTQATGGNYSFLTEIEGRNEIGGRARFGFPWADIGADGSCVIGKHDNTGGLVSVGTITSQLLYEIGGPRYLGPDVTARFDTITLEEIAPDRVRISGTVGEPPPSTLKVATNEMGGFRNSFSVALTGLDIEEKAKLTQATFWDACPLQPDDFDALSSEIIRTDSPDPATQAEATAVWRLTVKDREEQKVGRAFSDAMIHTALASIPGMYGLGGGPSSASPYGVYRPARVASELVPQYVHVLGGSTRVVDAPMLNRSGELGEPLVSPDEFDDGPTTDLPLGTIVGTRSGDKGGHANLGVFVRTDVEYRWLAGFLTVARLEELLPEATPGSVERFEFPNILSLNFLLRGFLDEGVAASTRSDPQAKALGEWLRARIAPIPAGMLNSPEGGAS